MNIKTRPFTSAEFQALLQASPEPWRQIFHLAYITGLRVSDLIVLQALPVFDTMTIIERKTRKSRTIPVGPVLRDLIDYFLMFRDRPDLRKFYLRDRQNLLLPFGDPSAYRKAVVRYAAFAHIPLTRVAFHSIRKTTATQIASNIGVIAASQYLGHSRLNTTMMYIEEDAVKVSNLLEAQEQFTGRVRS